MFNEANIELLNIKKNILKYINDIRDHRTKTIDNDTNKKIKIDKSTNKNVTRDKSTNKKITKDTSTNKKVGKSTNKNIIIDKSTIKEITINKIIPDNNKNISHNILRKRKGVNACNNINNTSTCMQRKNELKQD